MRHVKKARLAVFAASAALVGVTAGPAHAADSGPEATAAAGSATCPEGSVCLYEETQFGGDMLPLISLEAGGTCVSLVDHGWSGRVNSALNTSARSAALFANDDCVGGPFQVAGDSGNADLGTFSPESVWVPSLTR